MSLLSIFDTVSAAEKGATLHLVHPITKEPVYADGDKQKKPLTITLKGLDSVEFEREIQRRARQNKNKKDDIYLEQAKLEAAQTYARLTIGWENIPEFPEFSFENAVKLYLNYKDIRVQVGDFIVDKSNFIKA